MLAKRLSLYRITFWRKHRIHFKIISRAQSIQEPERTRERDLERAEQQDRIQAPAPCLHPRLENLQSPRRWATEPLGRTMDPSPQQQVSPITCTQTFTPFTAATIPDDPFDHIATPASVSHFVPATRPRDPQGFQQQKP